ncbi:MAG: hypothetical protein WKG06_05125 [Segetibacter sp.]
MQQIFLPQPTDNAPGYKRFLYSEGREDDKISDISPNTSYRTNISDSANSFFSRDFNWEYFSNELEFE